MRAAPVLAIAGVLSLTLLLTAGPVACNTIHVPGNAPTIQAGINLAASGDTVLVAPGTYTLREDEGDEEINFNGKAIVVRSQAGPASTRIHCVPYEAIRGFRFDHAETDKSILEGFTIYGGVGSYGGAIYCGGSSPTIRGCILRDNSATSGGAIACRSGAAPAISGCTIVENLATQRGAGVYCDGAAHPTLSHTIVAFGASGMGGEPVYCVAGSTALLSCCDLFGNVGGDWVGSIAEQYGTDGDISFDPKFCDLDARNLYVYTYSPCVHTAGCGTMGALGVGCGGEHIWYVPVMAPTIQAGIDSAAAGDTVLVASGTYHEHDLAMKSGVCLLGETGDASDVVIDAEQQGRVLRCEGVDETARIEHVTLTGGHAAGDTPANRGGGVYCRWARPTLASCVLVGNGAAFGGGLACTDASPEIVNCTFTGNESPNGGAVWCEFSSHPDFTNTLIAMSDFSAVECDGSSFPTFACSDIAGNWTDWADCIADQAGVRGNLSEDPAFCNWAAGNFHLAASSPCVAPPGCGRIGALGIGCGAETLWFVPYNVSSIRSALSRSTAGDTILVAPGTYWESGLSMKSGVVLRGETGRPEDVVIDGESDGNPVFYCNGVDASARIEGFTITHGSAGSGGGVHCTGSSLTIASCRFLANVATTNGGAVALLSSPCSLAECRFEENQAVDHGGALYCQGCTPTITDCHFEDNRVEKSGGSAVSCLGGAIGCTSGGSPVLVGCTFVGNRAQSRAVTKGGAISLYQNCSSTLSGCIFAENSAQYGGAIYAFNGSTVSMHGCTLNGNSATYGAGVGLYQNCSAEIENSIISFSPVGLPTWILSGSSATLSCCDLYGNAFGDWVGSIAGQLGVNGNICEEPLFCDAADGDLTLRPESPCAAENSPAGCGLIGALDVGCWPTEVSEVERTLPAELTLSANVPNPFNPVTEIGYAIPAGSGSSRVEIRIFNALGQRVRTLVDEEKTAGFYRATWDGKDDGGAPVASGVYFYRLTWNGRSETRRMVLLK